MLVFCYSAVRHDFLKLYSRHLVRLVLLQTLPRASGVLCHVTQTKVLQRCSIYFKDIYIYISCTHVSLSFADVAVCNSADAMMTANICRTGAMFAGGESVICRQRDNNAVGGRTFRLLPSLRPGFKDKQTYVQGTKLLQRRGRLWFAVYTTNEPPPPSSRVTPPKICW